MNKTKRIIALILSVLILIIGVFAVHVYASVTVDGYTYVLTYRDTASLIGWDNSSEVLVVPTYIGVYPVTDIGDNAFSEDTFITSLDMIGAVRLSRIGKYAFYNSAISGELIIPWQVGYVGVSAFEGCSSITSLKYYCDNASIPAQCFMNCSGLEDVEIGNTVTGIGRYAFKGCNSINSITIPASVASIDSTAFNGCDNIVVYCYTDSCAQQFAEDKGIEYVLIDAPLPTEPPTEAPTEAPTTQPTEPVTEEPTQPTSATEAPTEEPTLAPGSYILGDADGSGYVDIVDATFIQRIATNIDVPISREILMHADVDGDDDLTAIDATLIMRHLIRITTPYPIGEPVTT